MSAPKNTLTPHVLTQLHLADGSTIPATVAEDVDLDQEVVRDSAGRRLSEADAERLAEEVLLAAGRRAPGRPSLHGGAGRSPQIAFRVPDAYRDRAEQVARQRGTTVSALAREALEHYLDADS